MICLYRTQDLDDNNDPYCLDCWEAFHNDGDLGYRMSWYYADRQECMAENCVSEEEYNVLPQREHMEPRSLSGFAAG